VKDQDLFRFPTVPCAFRHRQANLRRNRGT
jgi:hypothetical protein